MRNCIAALLLLGLPMPAVATPAADFVDVEALEPTLRIELRYATADNFMHRPVYPPNARCYLRVAVAERLQAVQRDLRPLGLGLKLFDCYRPLSAQRALWAVVPDERYVAHPNRGSRHNRGAAVDLTLVDATGHELAMPTPYDAFSERAHRDYMKLPAEALKNRERLATAMARRGFLPLPTEWWHFDAKDYKSYPLDDVGFDALAGRTEDAAPRRAVQPRVHPPAAPARRQPAAIFEAHRPPRPRRAQPVTRGRPRFFAP